MIKTKKELKEFLNIEKQLYLNSNKCVDFYVKEHNYLIYKFQRLLRITEYYHNIGNKFMYLIYRRKKNILGLKLGIEIWDNCFDIGLQIFHSFGIVVNGNAIIGKNCKLHGNNCIGNDGKTSNAPILGDNVRLCVGAKIIGNVKLGNNVIVAAGAIVIDNFDEDNILLAGIPAKIVKRY